MQTFKSIENIPNPSEDPENRACHSACMNIWKQFTVKEITLQELLKEIAYIALRFGFDELRALPYPSLPHTTAFAEYMKLSFTERQKLTSQYFQKYLEINGYFQQKLWVKNHNKAILEWLQEIKTYIPKEDFPSQQKIEERILEFQAFDEGWYQSIIQLQQKEKDFYGR